MAETGAEGFSLEMALLEQLSICNQSGSWEWAKRKRNRKPVLLRILKRWARGSEEPPPTTSTLEHTETEAHNTAHRDVGPKGGSCWFR